MTITSQGKLTNYSRLNRYARSESDHRGAHRGRPHFSMPADSYPRGNPMPPASGPGPAPMHGHPPPSGGYQGYPPSAPAPAPHGGDMNRGYQPRPSVVDATGGSNDTARHAK